MDLSRLDGLVRAARWSAHPGGGDPRRRAGVRRRRGQPLGRAAPAEGLRGGLSRDLRGAPLTDLHPSELVTPAAWKARGDRACGRRRAPRWRLVAASVIVQDALAVERVQAGERREVSCGYECDLEARRRGACPASACSGASRYNHLGSAPRVGPRGRGRLAAPSTAPTPMRSTRLGARASTVSGSARRAAPASTRRATWRRFDEQRRDGDEPPAPKKDPPRRPTPGRGGDEEGRHHQRRGSTSRPCRRWGEVRRHRRRSSGDAAALSSSRRCTRRRSRRRSPRGRAGGRRRLPRGKRLARCVRTPRWCSAGREARRAQGPRSAKGDRPAMPTMRMDGLDARPSSASSTAWSRAPRPRTSSARRCEEGRGRVRAGRGRASAWRAKTAPRRTTARPSSSGWREGGEAPERRRREDEAFRPACPRLRGSSRGSGPGGAPHDRIAEVVIQSGVPRVPGHRGQPVQAPTSEAEVSRPSASRPRASRRTQASRPRTPQGPRTRSATTSAPSRTAACGFPSRTRSPRAAIRYIPRELRRDARRGRVPLRRRQRQRVRALRRATTPPPAAGPAPVALNIP